jgi:hypothetical protein
VWRQIVVLPHYRATVGETLIGAASRGLGGRQ